MGKLTLIELLNTHNYVVMIVTVLLLIAKLLAAHGSSYLQS